MALRIRPATEADLPAILAIHNDAITHSTAIWTLKAADLESRRLLLRDREARGYPFLVGILAGELVGYASFGDFRQGEGYRYTVEHSIYVRSSHRGQGVGKPLMSALIVAARELGKRVMMAGIEASNLASIRLHQGVGFIETGRLQQVGYKFDRWLDLIFMQKFLD